LDPVISHQWQIEWGKLALILVLMLGGFGLVFVALLDSDLTDDRFAITLALGSSIITGCMGYLFGNGRLASRGEASVPTLGAARRDPGRIRFDLVAGWTIVIVGVVTSALCAAYLLAAL
jgi:hypothetical protein